MKTICRVTNAGEVLEGEAPITAALDELKKPAVAQKEIAPAQGLRSGAAVRLGTAGRAPLRESA